MMATSCPPPGQFAAPEVLFGVEHGADVGVVLGIELDGGAGSPPEALQIARHDLLFQGIGGEHGISPGIVQGQHQVLQHQPAEEHTQEAEVKGGQDVGLGSGQAEGDRLPRHLQQDEVAQALAVVGEVGENGALDLIIMLLPPQGEAGKELQAAHGLGVHRQGHVVVPHHRTGGGVADEAEDLGGIDQIVEAFAQVHGKDWGSRNFAHEKPCAGLSLLGSIVTQIPSRIKTGPGDGAEGGELPGIGAGPAGDVFPVQGEEAPVF